MELKTYRAATMAEALEEVKKDLGRDAVILHTRTYKAGGVIGVGAKNIVEITASNSAAAGQTGPAPRQRTRPRQVAAPTPATVGLAERAEFTPVVFERGLQTAEAPPAGPVAEPPLQREPVQREPSQQPEPDPVPEPALKTPARPVRREPLAKLTERAEVRPVDAAARGALEAELASIKTLVGHVLRASHHNADAGRGTMPEPVFAHYCALIDHEVEPEIAESITGSVRDELTYAELADDEIVRASVLRQIAARLPAMGVSKPVAGPRVIALLGPTGVGKTTTVAKLAANLKLRHGKKVALVTSDTYRIAAVEQLRTYANIIGLPLDVVLTPEEARCAVAQHQDADVIVLDTAGRSQHDARRLDELNAFLEAAQPTERHLVVSSTISNAVMRAACARFGELKPDRMILTKLDESVHFGPLLNAAVAGGLPVSFVTTGQEVPDHIEPASSERLARLVLGGSLHAATEAPAAGGGRAR